MATISSDYSSEIVKKNTLSSCLEGSTIKYRRILEGVQKYIGEEPENRIKTTILRSLIRYIPNELDNIRWAANGVPIVDHRSMTIANNLGLTMEPKLHSLAVLRELNYLVATGFAKRVIGYVDKDGIYQRSYLYVRASANVPEHLVRPIGSIPQRTPGNYPPLRGVVGSQRIRRRSTSRLCDDVLNMIPNGLSNAVTSRQLAEQLGVDLTDKNRYSSVRVTIQKLVKAGYVHSAIQGSTARCYPRLYWK